jgi:hypothetical protein
LHLLHDQCDPLHVFEESVVLDVFRALAQVAISLRQVMVSEVPDYALGCMVEVRREPDLLSQNHLKDLIRVLMHIRALANHELIYKYSQAVPVHCFAMTLVHEDLRSQILRSPAQRISSFSLLEVLDEAKIWQFEEAAFLDKHVLWLQISIDEVFSVEILESQDDLSGVELGQGWL